MASLKEIFERAQQTGQVEYTYFGGTNVSPFNQTTIPVYPGTNKKLNSQSPYIRLGYEGGFPGDAKFRAGDPSGVYNTGLATIRDTARIGAFFTDFPNGPLWLAKQSSLQLSNPDTAYAPEKFQLDGPRIYNPLGTNTLSSVAGNALGLHFTRHGLSPTNDIGYISLNTEGGNFLSRLDKYYGTLTGENSYSSINLFQYNGGPDSFFGLGKTKTETYNDSFRLNTGVTNKNPNGLNSQNQAQNLGFKPWNYQTITSYGSVESKNPLITPPVAEFGTNQLTTTLTSGIKNQSKYPLDFRQQYENPNAEDYPRFNLHQRIGMTTPADPKSTVGPSFPVDSINVLTITPRSVFYGNSNPANNPTNTVNSNLIYSGLYDQNEVKSKTGGNYGRDIIKFRIELLNNDLPVFANTINTDVLAFRAYLDTLTDDFKTNWKTFNYMGRGEPFYTYENYARTINFSFVLMAHSKYEMPAIYTKLNYLMSSFAPDYNDRNQMRGNYAYLTIGDYIYQQPGVFTSMNITNLVGDGSAPWEIQLSEPEFRRQSGNENQIKDRYQHEVPTYMKITMAFNPIHNFLPRKNKREREHTATFVTPNFKIGHPNYYLPQNTQYKKLISPLALAFGPQENPISQVSTLINVPEQNIVQK
jgi:hypothetical protein